MTFNKQLNPELYKFYIDNQYLYINQVCKGAGIKIALLDTGVDYYNQDLTAQLQKGYSVFGVSDYYYDNIGHGTFMAGLLKGFGLGLLPKSEVYPIKVIDSDGNTSYDDIEKGLNKALEYKVDIIYFPIAFTQITESLLNKFIEIIDNDTLIVAAYPKVYNNNYFYYPMMIPGVITIGINKTTELISYDGPTISLGPQNSYDKDEGSSSVASLIAVIYFAMIKEYFMKRNEWTDWKTFLIDFKEKYLYNNILGFNKIQELYQYEI